MNELLGLAYYAEIPAVLVDVQRVGPSTGMPTRTQQGDILLVRLRLARRHQAHPAVPGESRRSASSSRSSAFDLAERFQTPVFMLSRPRHRHERLGGARTEVGRRVPARPRHGARRRGPREDGRSSSATTTRTRTASPRARCRASDAKGAYFTRGSGHNKFGGYTEIPDEYQEVVDRLKRSTRPRPRYVPGADRSSVATARRVGVVTLGGCDLRGARGLDELRRAGIVADFMRVRGFPFGDDVREFVEEHTTTASSSSRTATPSCARC